MPGPTKRRFRARFAVAVASVLALALSLAACGSGGDSSGSPSSSPTSSSSGKGPTRVVATSADFPPLSSRSPDDPNTVVGFEPDMMHAILGHLGWNYKTVTSDFNGLIPSVQSGRVDMVVSDVYDTAERRRVVDFVDYLSNNFSVMVAAKNADKTKSFTDICGQAMGILTGSAPELEAARAGSKQCTSAGKPAIKTKSYPAVAQELPALDNGTLYAILETNVSLAYIEQKQNGKYKLVFDVPGNKTKVGIVLKKGSPLEADLKKGVAWYISTPQYAANAKKWGLPDSSLLTAAG